MFGQTFYWQTIRKYVSLFGTLFDDIHIIRTNTSGQETAYIKVPITYAPKEKMLARVQQDPNIDRPTATLTMPFMSFEMTDVKYDGDRKLKTIQRTANKLTTNASSLQYQYMPVPYNFGFKLFIMVKNAEDGTKIVEQILPYFTPDFTVTKNVYIETKGLWVAKDRQKALFIKEQHPHIRILYVFQRNQALYKGSKNTYLGWCEKQGLEACTFSDTRAWKEFILKYIR